MNASSLPSRFAREFPQRSDLIYLDHAAVAPWPKRTCDAVKDFATENMRQGALDYSRWNQDLSQLRQRLAELLNAPSPDDIALLKNTSEALSTVAYGIDWNAGDNVVTFAQEFPSNRIVWESLSSRGVEVRLADLTATRNPEELLTSLCDRHTRLVSCSAVQYADGQRMDIDLIGGFCRARNILFCVDAIQGLGALPFDVQICKADFAMADGHKWMLGPEGLAVFYCRAEIRDQLRLNQYGWNMVEHAGDFERTDWRPAASARRFECGSPNMLGVRALHTSLGLLQETGMDQVSKYVLDNTLLMMDLIDRNDFTLVSARDAQRRSGIVTFRIEGRDHTELRRNLRRRGVVCAYRGGGIRFSPHFYIDSAKIEQAFDIVNDCLCGDGF